MIIIILNILIICFLLRFLIKNYKDIARIVKISLIMILGGGTSNLIDRIFRGYVIDYIDINKIISYPICNIADIGVVIGVSLLIIYVIIKNRRMPKSEKI